MGRDGAQPPSPHGSATSAEAITHVDTVTGGVLETFTTSPAVELFLLGQRVPTRGVPVNTYLHADEAGVKGTARD